MDPGKGAYTFVRHQVRRDLDLVKSIGAHTKDDRITIRLPENRAEEVRQKLTDVGSILQSRG